jgi:hypothetical protein
VYGGAFLIYFYFAIAVLFSGGGFAGGGWGVGLFLGLFDAGVSEFLSIGFGGMMGAFGGRVVEEECRLWAVPGIGFIVFIKFDFEVYLHENNNNSIL